MKKKRARKKKTSSASTGDDGCCVAVEFACGHVLNFCSKQYSTDELELLDQPAFELCPVCCTREFVDYELLLTKNRRGYERFISAQIQGASA